MTKSTRPADFDQPIEQLLQAAPRTIRELADLLGAHRMTIRRRLEALEEHHRVYRVRAQSSYGMLFRWHLGVIETAAPHDLDPFAGDLAPQLRPNQATVRVYPAISRRDPLVAALFGAAGAHHGR